MGNDLLFYESRKRAVERVREMQKKNEEAALFSGDGAEEDKKDGDFNITGEENFENNFGPRYNNGNFVNNKRGDNSFLGSFFKGGSFESIKAQVNEAASPFKNLMEKMGLDSEKLIIIMIMWMLFNEKEDKTLLLALGYLLL